MDSLSSFNWGQSEQTGPTEPQGTLKGRVHLSCGGTFGFWKAKQSQRDETTTDEQLSLLSAMHKRYNHAKKVQLAAIELSRLRRREPEVMISLFLICVHNISPNLYFSPNVQQCYRLMYRRLTMELHWDESGRFQIPNKADC